MRDYHFNEKINLGSSDIARVTLIGWNGKNCVAEFLKFGSDGSYKAYTATPEEVPESYEKIAVFRGWVNVVDDDEIVAKIRGDEIAFYRRGEFGCIVTGADLEASRVVRL